MSAGREEEAEHDAEREVRDDRDGWRLGAVVQAEQARVVRATASDVGPARSDAILGCTPGSSGTKNGERDADVQQAEQRAEPPRCRVEQRERRRVAEREALHRPQGA